MLAWFSVVWNRFWCLSPCLCDALGEIELLRSFELALALAIQPLGSRGCWVWFSALWSAFKQSPGACTLDVSLKLVLLWAVTCRVFLAS